MISPGKGTQPIRVVRYREGQSTSRKDVVAVEEPLEIRIEDRPNGGAPRMSTVSVTMRTPGDDFQLAAGFLRGEGLLQDRRQFREISYCSTPDEPQQYNIVVVRLRPGEVFDPDALDRNFYMSSSCGVCGKASLEAVEVQCDMLPDGEWSLEPDVLAGIPDVLRDRQGLFDRTGGIHAAGLFTASGELVDLKEDVGRHNAVDKVVGEAFMAGRLPLDTHILAVSGRTSFEIMQKAVAAGIPVVVAVGAPSSLAVDLAKRFNLTLLGFTRGGGFNVYAGDHRIAVGG